MSSICVAWKGAGGSEPAVLLADMLSAQAGCGANSSFFWADHFMALGGNLLRLLPEDGLDHQPLWTSDKSFCLVADVRLDNRKELALELTLFSPESLADSDILFACWQRWGRDCLQHIVGSFAFAVWTPSRQELFAARDHSGDRPLYYYRRDGLFALSSMPNGILALPEIPRGVDESRLIDALALANPDPRRSFHAAIQRLPQASYLLVTPGHLECKPYWAPFDAKPIRYAKDSDYEEAFLEIFDRAVASRLRTTGPISSQLSAGMDSSSVSVSAALQLALRGDSLTAYTAVPRPGFLGKGFHGRLPDEGPGAAEVAALYSNIAHFCIDSSGTPLLSTLQATIDAIDEPVQNGINLLWLTAILRAAAARGSSALLVGFRGNATLSYSGLEALSIKFRRGHLVDLFSSVRRLRSNGHISWRSAFAQSTIGLLPDRVFRTLRRGDHFSIGYSPANPHILATHHLRDRMLHEFYNNSGDLNLERTLFFERFDYGVYNAAMRNLYGVDLRDPCADKRLFDFCYAIPFDQYIAGGHNRSLVRRAMRGRLPDSTLARTIRGQQGADWYLTMQEAKPTFAAAAAEIEHSPSAQRFLDLPRMRHLLDTWPDSGLEELDTSQAYGDALCRFMSFGYFLAREDAASAAQSTPG